ncbi:class I SAM-dependent methyltransferase [Hamadaea tsunoensis]|uniref:class I SAM-dependent methyltransferase n=1 Tax=Hamadaea tsunoensis TaxID=53368 RepID=UPI000409A1E5|nr:class I SAM-dependent methyltransferase [Hamadaea tsunoensis]
MDLEIRDTRSTYEVVAGEFARAQAEGHPELRHDIDSFARMLPPALLVADVGCGPGRDLTLLRAAGMRAVGFDLTEAMLRVGGRSGVAQADMRHLPVRTGALDGIWCQAALLHIPHRYAPAVVAEFARCVRAGGAVHLAVAEGSGEGWEEFAYGSDGRRWFAYHTEESLGGLLAAHGLAVVEVRRHHHRRDWLRMLAVRNA